MQKKVADEGEKEKVLYDRCMGYCSGGPKELEASIKAAEEKIPVVSSAIDGAMRGIEDAAVISIRGVTHYANEIGYWDLSEWQRDQEMYRKLVQIPFFDEYQRSCKGIRMKTGGRSIKVHV